MDHLVVFSLLLFCSTISGLEQCTDDSFSIAYAGSTFFAVSKTDGVCGCQGPIQSASGRSQMKDLVVESLTVLNSTSGKCSADCRLEYLSLQSDYLSRISVVQNDSQTRVSAIQADYLTRISAMQADFLTRISAMQTDHMSRISALQTTLTKLQSTGITCNGGGGGGGSGGSSGSSFCSIDPPDNGFVIDDLIRATAGTTVIFACNSGYRLVGASNVTCVGGGVFNKVLPTCQPLPCVAVAPANGAVSAVNIPLNGTVVYSCQSGYTMSTNSTAQQRCYAAAFSDRLPVCIGNPCLVTPPVNGTASASVVPHGGTVNFTCLNGTFLMGISSTTCNAGQLLTALPNCTNGQYVHLTMSSPNPWYNGGGCSDINVKLYTLGSSNVMSWRSCMILASRIGAAVQQDQYFSNFASYRAWVPSRNGNMAQIASNSLSWNVYYQDSITTLNYCILSRDNRYSTFTRTLANTIFYDGDTWAYQDMGSMIYSQCFAWATQSGAMMVHPTTIGLPSTGLQYHIPTVHSCNTFSYSTGPAGYNYDSFGGSAVSSSRQCLVAYIVTTTNTFTS